MMQALTSYTGSEQSYGIHPASGEEEHSVERREQQHASKDFGL